MIALTRFHLAGYLRSLRVLHPLIAVALLVILILLDQPPSVRLVVGSYGDTAAFMFPIWAWTARALLDTQPDVQRDLTALADTRDKAHRTPGHAPITQSHRDTPASASLAAPIAGLLAAYLVNAALAALVLFPPLITGLTHDVPPGPMLTAVALNLLAGLAATLLGAWTSRAIIPAQAVSILALLGGCTALLLLSMGPLAWLSVPMIEWLKAAHDGPAAFTAAFPGLAAHLAAWSAVVGAAYLLARRHRP